MKPGAKLFIDSDSPEGVFGDGRWRLLMEIDRLGSISRAADSLGRGYRKAWGDIRSAERSLGRPLVKKKRGGANGGATELTSFGRELIEAWAKYRMRVISSVDSAYERYLARLFEEEKR